METPSELERARAELNAELSEIAKWSAAPHLLYAREQALSGQLETDYARLDSKLQDFIAALSTTEQAKFSASVQEITAAFGGVIIHAGYQYDDQRDVMRGWQEVWRQLDNALKGFIFLLNPVSIGKKKSGQSGGAGGRRADLFDIGQGCA
jgi:hypothetical protein